MNKLLPNVTITVVNNTTTPKEQSDVDGAECDKEPKRNGVEIVAAVAESPASPVALTSDETLESWSDYE